MVEGEEILPARFETRFVFFKIVLMVVNVVSCLKRRLSPNITRSGALTLPFRQQQTLIERCLSLPSRLAPRLKRWEHDF